MLQPDHRLRDAFGGCRLMRGTLGSEGRCTPGHGSVVVKRFSYRHLGDDCARRCQSAPARFDTSPIIAPLASNWSYRNLLPLLVGVGIAKSMIRCRSAIPVLCMPSFVLSYDTMRYIYVRLTADSQSCLIYHTVPPVKKITKKRI